MIELHQIDNFFLYSYKSDGNLIRNELDLDKKSLSLSQMIKLMRNNFSRFWNLLTKEQQIKYIKLSVEKEDLYELVEKIIRYSCEVSRVEFIENFFDNNLDNDDLDDNLDKFNYLRHDLVRFWISIREHEKIKFIELVSEYWTKNKYYEYYPWNINIMIYSKEEKLILSNRGLKSINMEITDDIKYLDFSNNSIENTLIIPFARHSWYTTLYINAFLLNSPNSDAMLQSLLETPKWIARAVQKFATVKIYDRVKIAMTNHIALAGAALAALKAKSSKLPEAVKAVREQTSELAEVFSCLNPCVLKYKMMKKMWLEHVDYVIEISTLVNSGKYTEANLATNAYTDQMQEMAIMIADGESQAYCCNSDSER